MSRLGHWARRNRRPVADFLRIEAASGVWLLLATAVALVWANSTGASYQQVWHAPWIGPLSPAWLVNDVGMVLFFFVVGLEIRREVHHGELRTWRRATLPAAAALGGMLMPACLYVSLARVPPLRSGWGVPMATDIAFALGVLALLGRRVPPALRVLLLALAVIDDLGAIVVIAVFYARGIDPLGLVLAAAGLGSIIGLQRWKVQRELAYVLPAGAVWAGVAMAGIHPTIAGVLVGLLTPVIAPPGQTPPADRWVTRLHPWVAWLVLPLFALANAGVPLTAGSADPATTTVTWAVVFGLVAGKPLGVVGATWLVRRLGLGELPASLRVRHIVVLGLVAGIGFTMALFVAQLAFDQPALLAAAKRGVLWASGVAAVLALLLGRWLLPRPG